MRERIGTRDRDVVGADHQLPSSSTLYPFLRAHGLDQRRAPQRRDHRAYAFDLAGDCWQSEVMYGPSLREKDGTRILEELFLEETTRRVAKDGTFTLRGKVFEAGPTLIGERVSVYFDPFDLRRVYVNNRRGEKLEAFPVDLEGNRRVRRNPPPEPKSTLPPPELKAIEDLAREIQKKRLDLYREIARGFQIEPRFRKADVLREIKDRIVKLSRVQKLRAILVCLTKPTCFPRTSSMS